MFVCHHVASCQASDQSSLRSKNSSVIDTAIHGAIKHTVRCNDNLLPKKGLDSTDEEEMITIVCMRICWISLGNRHV